MRDLALAAIVFGLLPFCLKRPFWGVLMLTWLGYMNPHRLCYGFMLSFPIVQVTAIVTLIGLLVSKEPKRLVWSREITVLAVFVAWMGITTTQAYYPDAAFDQYVKIIKVQVLTFMTLLTLTSPERIRAFIWVIVLSVGFFGFKGGVFTILHGGSYQVYGPDGSFISGNNELALALVMTIPLMRYLQLTEERRIVRLGLTLLMLLSAISAIGSQSRGALLALSIVGFMFWLKGRNKLGVALLTLVAAAAVAAIMPDAWYERMSTIRTYDEDNSALGRINAWYMAFNMASHRFFGGGFESFQAPIFAMFAPEADRVHDSHSIYFQVMGHHGFIGLALFLSLVALTWRKCSTLRRLTAKREDLRWAHDLGAMMQVTWVGYLCGGAFLGLAYFDYPYHLVAIAVVAHRLVIETLAKQSRLAKAVDRAARSAPATAPAGAAHLGAGR